MNAIATVTAAALLVTAGAAVAVAQTQPPTQTPSSPDAASSPHQRQATGTDSSEAPATNGADPEAASTPHQRGAMHGASKMGNAMSKGANPEAFVKTAAADGMTEVGMAKLALKKSSNNDVKQFAQKMQQDHEQADEELASIAKSKGLTLPKKPDTKSEAMMKMLSAKSGAAFDREYADHMAKDHSKAVALFQAASQSSDPELAAFAKKTLPTLQEHKQLADNLKASVGTRTASADKGSAE
jgi:putative membrane protein